MECGVCLGLVANLIEDKEFCLWCEKCSVSDAGGCQVALCLVCNLTWVAVVKLTVAWEVNVERDDQGLLDAERIDVCGCHIWNQLHVLFVNRSKTANRGCVEELPVGKEVLVDLIHWQVEVLLNAW